MSPSNLTQITRRAATGDTEARHVFEARIVPMVETVVRRWLKQQSRELARPTQSETPAAMENVARITAAVCTRLMRRFRARCGARLGDETFVARQALDTHVGSTLPATG